MVEVKLKQWGNSIGVILPKNEIKELGLRKGDKIELKISSKQKVDGFGLCKNMKPFEEEKENHKEFW